MVRDPIEPRWTNPVQPDRRINCTRSPTTGLGLVYVNDAAPGIRRLRRGRGFVYVDQRKRKISAPATLERIRRLAIPPAYTDVWICPNARGHLQATGRDAAGRKQYRYHARWRTARDAGKFERLVEFGTHLPRLRRALRRDLAFTGLPEAKVLAIVVSLLAETHVRVGNEAYARANGSYGLTTLRSRHLQFRRSNQAMLRFRGKSGQAHDVPVTNGKLVRLLRRCQQLPGQRLFQYVGDDGRRHTIDSGAVNSYLGEVMQGDFTAKDFRTWSATTAAAAHLARTPLPTSGDEAACKAVLAEVTKLVAADLRNTPAVCRNSYIHPGVFDAWRDGRLHRLVPLSATRSRSSMEKAVIRLLRRARGK